MGVVIVDDMEETPTAPWHPLDQSNSEQVERNCDLHDCIFRICVMCTQKHHIIMVVEFAVRDGNSRGTLDHINEPISSSSQRNVVDPYVARAIDADGISITPVRRPMWSIVSLIIPPGVETML